MSRGASMCGLCGMPMADGVGHACSRLSEPDRKREERFVLNDLIRRGVKPTSVFHAPIGAAFPIPSKWVSRRLGTAYVLDRNLGGEPIVCEGRFSRTRRSAWSVERWNEYIESGARRIVPWDR